MKAHGLNLCTKGVWALILLAAGLFVGACSFETSLSGLECDDENATRAGEVCRDGYWRVDEVADVKDDPELDVVSDVVPPRDTSPTDTTDVSECVAPAQRCGTQCVDTQTSSSHCGQCDSPCASGLICEDGQCVGEPLCEPGTQRPCFADNNVIEQGVCQAGTQYCSDDATWGECIGQILPGPEVCNGLDDNCDGVVDDGNPQGGGACETGLAGICSAGTETCQDGGIVCVPNQEPGPEKCGPDGTGNGLDDNCDGQVDEGCASCTEGATQSCYSGSPADVIAPPSICRHGTQTCIGGEWGPCLDEVTPIPEVCDIGGLDENCDGSVNEGCDCLNGQTESCGHNSVGMCSLGTKTCVQGQWAECVGAQLPSAERCDDLDHDCDGDNHNGFDVGATCVVGEGACANTGVLVCAADGLGTRCDATPLSEKTFYLDADGDGYGDPSVSQQGCVAPAGYVEDHTDCDDTDAGVNPGAEEVCDGKDNNCSGTVDDGGASMCSGSRVCQDGSCCRQADSGSNRCLGRLCDSNDANCASGYCEIVANSFGSGRNDICQPAHCGNGVQDADEAGVDCGGAWCRKCNGELCEHDSECNSDRCGNRSGKCR